MNCERAQQRVLLAGTGELPDLEVSELNEHLGGCEECRGFSRETARILSVAGNALPDGDPSTAVMNAIMARAQSNSEETSTIFFRPAIRLLAYAAGFMLILAGGYLYLATEPDTTHPSKVSQMSTIVAMVGEDETATIPETVGNSERDNLRALARQLLQHEGLLLEEAQVDEETILQDDALPRDLQSRSTFGARQAGCV